MHTKTNTYLHLASHSTLALCAVERFKIVDAVSPSKSRASVTKVAPQAATAPSAVPPVASEAPAPATAAAATAAVSATATTTAAGSAPHALQPPTNVAGFGPQARKQALMAQYGRPVQASSLFQTRPSLGPSPLSVRSTAPKAPTAPSAAPTTTAATAAAAKATTIAATAAAAKATTIAPVGDINSFDCSALNFELPTSVATPTSEAPAPATVSAPTPVSARAPVSATTPASNATPASDKGGAPIRRRGRGYLGDPPPDLPEKRVRGPASAATPTPASVVTPSSAASVVTPSSAASGDKGETVTVTRAYNSWKVGCKYKKSGVQIQDLQRMIQDAVAGTSPTTTATATAEAIAAVTVTAATATPASDETPVCNELAERVKELEIALADIEKTNIKLTATVEILNEERDKLKKESTEAFAKGFSLGHREARFGTV